MTRLIVILIAVLVVLVGGVVLLAARDGSRPPVRVEKAVALENLQK